MNETNSSGGSSADHQETGDVHICDVIRRRVKGYRTAEGWSQQNLADVLTEITGRPVSRIAVTNLESVKRQQQVDVETLFALALAFDVAPVELCVSDQGDDVIRVGSRRNLSDNWRDFFRDGPPEHRPTYGSTELLGVLVARMETAAARDRPMALIDIIGTAQSMLKASMMHADRLENRKGGEQ